jgi:predicted RNA-binding Zn-ribbon protein involved in translation (DUF1610 family)
MAIVASLYRCANCGSKNVVPYSKNGAMKNPLGDILSHKEIIEFRCPDCGAVLDHAMADGKKAYIDEKQLSSDGEGYISGAFNKKK